MICGLGAHYAVAAAAAAAALPKRQARAQHLAKIGGLGESQQAGLNQMMRNSIAEKTRTRKDMVLDMEIDLSRYLNRSDSEG